MNPILAALIRPRSHCRQGWPAYAIREPRFVLTIVPHVVTLLVGRYVFGMYPGILLGVCCGAGTSASSLAAVQDVAKSKIPTLGHGVTYAVGNVLLPLWGSVIVALMQRT